jgi:hypothetical protein
MSTSLLQLVDNLQQAGKIRNLQQVCGVSGCVAECTSYFTKTFSAISPTKTFNIPSWIPKFASPQTPFNLDPPTYRDRLNGEL